MDEKKIISSVDKSERGRLASRYLYCAMSIGEKLLACGAEVSRVEDTISRICHAYGVERVDVFTITSSIVVTISGEEFGVITQTRRIRGSQYNLRRLERLNQLSRKICASQMSVAEIEKELAMIEEEKGYSTKGMLLGFVIISASFALFFGGTVWDAMASAIIAILLKCFGDFLNKVEMNTFLTGFLSSVLGGLVAVIFVDCGFGQSVEYINLGNVMLLIPGI
ncbi:MAG: threonine/serine exporter family protein, partial [Clostridiales bacterium]|nr:threonine/serine exporter family protein [Clostridiales bacterium]